MDSMTTIMRIVYTVEAKKFKAMKLRATKRKMKLTQRIGVDFKFVSPENKLWWELYLSIYLYKYSIRITLEKH